MTVKWRRESVLDVYNLALAIVLFAAPWFLSLTKTTAELDLWISSAAIGLISIGALAAFTQWEEWANLLLGTWLIVSPWLLGFAHSSAMHFSIAVGVVVAFLAGLELWLVNDPEGEMAERQPQSPVTR